MPATYTYLLQSRKREQLQHLVPGQWLAAQQQGDHHGKMLGIVEQQMGHRLLAKGIRMAPPANLKNVECIVQMIMLGCACPNEITQ